MNSSLKKATRFLQKYKFEVCCTLVIIFFFIFFANKRFIEGFCENEIGEFDFLAPPPVGNKISNETLQKFIEKIAPPGVEPRPIDSIRERVEKDITEEEMLYYINNDMWPWGSFLVKTFKSSNPNMNVARVRSSFDANSRTAFHRLQYQVPEIKDSFAYQVFMGTAPPPQKNAPLPQKQTNLPTAVEKARQRFKNK